MRTDVGVANGTVYIRGVGAQAGRVVEAAVPAGAIEVAVYLDHSVIEVFAGAGYAAITGRSYVDGSAGAGAGDVALFARGPAACAFTAIRAWALRGIALL